MKFLIETPSNTVFLPLKYVPFTQKLTSEENALINFLHPDLKIFCDQCFSIIYQEDISIFVEQTSPEKDKKTDKDFCVKCFCSYLKSNGKLTVQKMNKGQYYVRNPGVNCLTSARWRVTDDLLLLKAIKKFGYGNWNKMAYYMQTHGCYMNPYEFQKHFLTYFYKGQHSNNIMHVKNQEFIIKDSSDENFQKENIKPQKKNVIKAKQLSDHFLQWKGTKNMGKDKILSDMPNIMSQIIGSFQRQHSQEFLDSNLEVQYPFKYIPERDQFLIDHDPYAQSLIADLEFNDDDDQQEISMKEKLLLAYNQKLKERKKRKMLAVNHNLIRTLAESEKKKNIKQRFFLNKSPQQPITAFLDPFFRLFRDQEEIRLTKTLITNHYNVKQILGTFCWVKKHANVRLSSFQTLQSILRNTIQNQSDDNTSKQINCKKLLKRQKTILYENQSFIQPSFEQKLIFLQSQINQNQSVSSIYQLKFDSLTNKSIQMNNTSNSKRNVKLQH